MEEMTPAASSPAALRRGPPKRQPLDEQACLERGQFMSGSCSGLIGQVQKAESFHRELAEGPLVAQSALCDVDRKTAHPRPTRRYLRRPVPRGGPEGRRRRRRRDDRDRVAITGMSVLNALGKSPEEVWRQAWP